MRSRHSRVAVMLAVAATSLAGAVAVTNPSPSVSTATPVTINTTATISDGIIAGFGWEMWLMLDALPNFTDPSVVRLASYLSGTTVRVGGISADWVRYVIADSEPSGPPTCSFPTPCLWPPTPRNWTTGDFRKLLTFFNESGIRMVLDLNELYGRSCHGGTNGGTCVSGDWDTSNVQAFLQYLHDNGLVGAPPAGAGLGTAHAHAPPSATTARATTGLGSSPTAGLGNSPLYAFELGNELISHLDYHNVSADVHRLTAIVQQVWGQGGGLGAAGEEGAGVAAAPALLPPVIAPATDSCGDPSTAYIMNNISLGLDLGEELDLDLGSGRRVAGSADTAAGVQPAYATTGTSSSSTAATAFSYHSYPGGDGKDLVSKCLDSNWLRNGLLQQTDSARCLSLWNAPAGPRSRGLQLWLTETSESWQWDLPPPAQNSFVHSFFYLASLGQYAATGITFHGRWSFSDPDSPFATLAWNSTAGQWDAAADFYINVLYRRTVGQGVLQVSGDESSGALVYASCSAGGAAAGGGSAGNGSVTVLVVNPANVSVTLALQDAAGLPMSTTPRLEYVLTAPGGTDIGSYTPVLNGDEAQPLRARPDGSIPDMVPAYVPAAAGAGTEVAGGTGAGRGRTSGTAAGDSQLTVPALSQSFFVLLGAKAAACTGSQSS